MNHAKLFLLATLSRGTGCISHNDAVARCDTNLDERITELEAKIFAQQNSAR
jgi:hypothetical protein